MSSKKRLWTSIEKRDSIRGNFNWNFREVLLLNVVINFLLENYRKILQQSSRKLVRPFPMVRFIGKPPWMLYGVLPVSERRRPECCIKVVVEDVSIGSQVAPPQENRRPFINEKQSLDIVPSAGAIRPWKSEIDWKFVWDCADSRRTPSTSSYESFIWFGFVDPSGTQHYSYLRC